MQDDRAIIFGSWMKEAGISQDQSPIIELKSVSFGFGSQNLFNDFGLKVQSGDSLVLVGPSGSGKSILLKLMSGLIKPQKGQVFYRGKDLSTLSKKEGMEFLSEVGMLFQQNALFDSMTVYENLNFVLKEMYPDWSHQQRDQEILEFLTAVGLDHVLSLYPGELSGGMQKRLGIARALVLKPRLVFYDDPTAGLDPITSRQIIQMILDLKKKLNATIVTVTHDMMRAYQLAGEIMVCFHGEFVKTGNAENTQKYQNAKVQQFINGEVEGPLSAL